MGTLYSICLETMWVLPKPLRIWREFFHAFSPSLGMDFSITGLEDFFNLSHDWGSIYLPVVYTSFDNANKGLVCKKMVLLISGYLASSNLKQLG